MDLPRNANMELSSYKETMSDTELCFVLDGIFIQLASVDSSDNFSALMHNLLPLLLGYAGSDFASVRSKVIEILNHISKRLKVDLDIQLPVNEVVRLLESNSNPFVQNFSMLYLKMGFMRLPLFDRCLLLNRLLILLESQQKQRDTILQLTVPVLAEIQKLPKAETDKLNMAQCFATSDLRDFLLDFILDIMLLPYGSEQKSTVSIMSGQTELGRAPPGMSEAGFQRVTTEAMELTAGDSEKLEELKVGLVKFLTYFSELSSEHYLPHLLIGLADAKHTVIGACETSQKKMTIDYNNTVLVTKIYELYLGGSISASKSKPRAAASLRMRLKIMQLFLSRSRVAATTFPQNVQVVYDSLFGLHLPPANSKLKLGVVEFVKVVAISCEEPQKASVLPLLYSAMSKLANASNSETSSGEDVLVRAAAFVAIGKIGAVFPSIVNRDMSLLQRMFETISGEPETVAGAIQECLSLWAPAFGQIRQPMLSLMEALMNICIVSEDTKCRMLAVKYIDFVFPRNNVPSRYLLFVAAGDSKEEIQREARRILFSVSTLASEENESKKPKMDVGQNQTEKEQKMVANFNEMVDYLYEKAEQIKQCGRMHRAGQTLLYFPPVVFETALTYLRNCLYADAGISLHKLLQHTSQHANSSQLSTAVRNKLSTPVPVQLATPEQVEAPTNSVLRNAKLLLQFCCGDPSSARSCWQLLLELFAVSDFSLAPLIAEKLGFLQKSMLSSASDELVPIVAELVGCCAVELAWPQPEPIERCIKDQLAALRNTAGTVNRGCQGPVLLCSFAASRILRKLAVEETTAPLATEKRQTLLGLVKLVFVELRSSLLAACSSSSQQLWLVEILCSALAELARALSFSTPLRLFFVVENEAETTENGDLTTLIEALLELAQSQKEAVKPRLREKAALALGFLATGDNEKLVKLVLTGLLKIGQGPPQPEHQFCVGEALTIGATGYHSAARRNLWTQCAAEFHQNAALSLVKTETSSSNLIGRKQDEANYGHATWLLEEILTKLAVSENRHLRQASYIWLLVILQRCGVVTKHPAVVQRLESIQAVLGNGLGEASDFTQDVVSKAMGIVYDIGSAEQRERLVKLLVETLTVGKRPGVHKVTGDTEVFARGSLGTTPSGESLSTYQELCSLANDMNQPDLVYRFMHLANHQAIWNSKSGAAFGFSAVMSQAKEQLEPLLPKIVPRLFRYQFDPSAKVQQAMRSIWQVITSNHKNVVKEYSAEIFNDLLRNLTNACLAMSDLISNEGLVLFIDSLEQLWETLFRVRDDIKESCRLASERTLSTLKRVVSRSVGPDSGQKGQTILGIALRVLLEKGVQSSAAEVRSSSLATIIAVSKDAGALMKPHLVMLVPKLLEALSEMEPSLLNYIAVRATGSQLERIDGVRVAHSKMSPAMDTINQCVRYIDSSVLSQIAPRLMEVLRSSCGLGTKAGCCAFITGVCLQCQRELTADVADKLLRGLMQNLNDRNATVRKQAASTIGYLVKFVSETGMFSLANFLKNLYIEKATPADRLTCAKTLQVISQQCPELLKEYGDQLLPVVFLGMCSDVPKDPDAIDDVTQIWEEIWSDSTPGSEGGLRLYINQIIELCRSILLDHPAWALKADATRALAKAVEISKSNLDMSQTVAILKLLIDLLHGRTWDGKENVLHAIGTLCSSCSTQMDNAPKSELFAALMKECKKAKLSYRVCALSALEKLVNTLQFPCLQEVWLLLEPYLRKPESLFDSDAEDSKEELRRRSEARREFLIVAVDLIGSCASVDSESLPITFTCKQQVVDYIVKNLPSEYWTLQLSFLKALQKIVTSSNVPPDVLSELLFIVLMDCCDSANQAALKKQCLLTLEAVSKLSQCAGNSFKVSEDIQTRLEETLVHLQQNR